MSFLDLYLFILLIVLIAGVGITIASFIIDYFSED